MRPIKKRVRNEKETHHSEAATDILAISRVRNKLSCTNTKTVNQQIRLSAAQAIGF